MKRAHVIVTLALALVVPAAAFADDLYDPSGRPPHGHVPTWGTARVVDDATSVMRDSPVTRARELLSRSRFLDNAASIDEKDASDLAAKLPSLRAAARTAREHADRATVADKEALGAQAEDLDTEVIVSEAEITFKRKVAADNRRASRELRLRAVKLLRETSTSEESATYTCDPPFRYTADARKIYRLECMR